MTDTQSESDRAASASTSAMRADRGIEDAVVVEDPNLPVDVETAHASANEPIVATTDPGAVQTVPRAATGPTHHVVYVQAPEPPAKAGNRGIGSLIAIASGVVYAVAFAVVVSIILLAQVGRVSFDFIALPSFYVPVLFYVIGLVLLVLVLNRAGWGAYVFGSIIVGLVVYFGSIAVLVLGRGIVLLTPAEAGTQVASALIDPFVIAAGLVAREVALWTGALISRRGRRVKARNADARAQYERDVLDRRAEHDRAAAAAAS